MRKNGYVLYTCPSCGLAVTDLNRDYADFIEDYYSKGYFTGDPQHNGYVNYEDDKPYILRNMRKYLKKIQRIKKSGKLLDVGCAMGFFMELAQKAGYDAYGFDPSSFAVTQAKGLMGSEKVQCGTIETVKYLPKSFDVITLLDVFEHLADPLGDLKKLTRLLKDDGIMLIATGDTKSLMARILKRRWTFYNPPQHVYFFNHDTLTDALKKTGLESVRWFRVGKWLSLRYVLHLARTGAESPLAGLLYPLTQKFSLGKIPLFLPVGDNMVVIARKRV